MIVKLLTEHHLVFLSLKGGCTSESYACQNATLLEISCTGSFYRCNTLYYLVKFLLKILTFVMLNKFMFYTPPQILYWLTCSQTVISMYLQVEWKTV